MARRSSPQFPYGLGLRRTPSPRPTFADPPLFSSLPESSPKLFRDPRCRQNPLPPKEQHPRYRSPACVCAKRRSSGSAQSQKATLPCSRAPNQTPLVSAKAEERSPAKCLPPRPCPPTRAGPPRTPATNSDHRARPSHSRHARARLLQGSGHSPRRRSAPLPPARHPAHSASARWPLVEHLPARSTVLPPERIARKTRKPSPFLGLAANYRHFGAPMLGTFGRLKAPSCHEPENHTATLGGTQAPRRPDCGMATARCILNQWTQQVRFCELRTSASNRSR